ncbi:MAG: ribosome biogenesis GTPase YlqF [Acholeplasmataceae bacterium]|nr:ribosome biogenesis GTPase YlqF [Acholeplasmataceae bacterium]
MKSKQIQWFPGHMFKSLREIKGKLKLMDIVFILLDARLPLSSMNPEVLKLVQHKKAILLFNKMDLADDAVLNQWITHYQKLGFSTLKIDAQSGKNVNKIYLLAQDILKEKLERDRSKGLKERSLKTMILGIPNVGKSTLINQLSKSKAARTGNIPGVTKAQQWIKMGDHFELLDTPGVLWPKFDDETVAYHLAISGAIKDKILPEDDVVHYALMFLKKHYPDRLKERYNLDAAMNDYVEMLDFIGKQRGAFIKGGEMDYPRIYQIVLTDLRNNQLGGLSFDRLESIRV